MLGLLSIDQIKLEIRSRLIRKGLKTYLRRIQKVQQQSNLLEINRDLRSLRDLGNEDFTEMEGYPSMEVTPMHSDRKRKETVVEGKRRSPATVIDEGKRQNLIMRGRRIVSPLLGRIEILGYHKSPMKV